MYETAGAAYLVVSRLGFRGSLIGEVYILSRGRLLATDSHVVTASLLQYIAIPPLQALSSGCKDLEKEFTGLAFIG